jgi:hypothetical protein
MATMIWTLLSIFVIAPLGALAFDRPLFGNWIWHIAPEKVRDYEEHSGVTWQDPTPSSSGRFAARDHRCRHGARGDQRSARVLSLIGQRRRSDGPPPEESRGGPIIYPDAE